MACLGKFPYFAYQKVTKKRSLKSLEEGELGQGPRPNAPLWVYRSVPKSIREMRSRKKSGDVLVGYYLKRVVTQHRSPNHETVLYVKDKSGFKRFMDRYGITVGFVDWDRVAQDWGGVEFGHPFLQGWRAYEVAIWSSLVIKNMEVCEGGTKKPIFITYTLSYCPYSQDVLEKLEKLKIPHLNYVVKEEDKEKLKKDHDWPTFPHVFIIGADGERYFLGGSAEFDEFLKQLI